MASRGWGNIGYGSNSSYMGSAPIIGNLGFYMGPPNDRRTMYPPVPVGNPYPGGYRDDNYRRQRDDYRGGRRPKAKSPSVDKRPHHDVYSPKKDMRPGKRQQPLTRYEIKIPKVALTLRSATFPELKHLHPRISIPTDLCKAIFSWQDAFPLHQPMKLGNRTDIYILHRDVESKEIPPPTALDVPDADYSYSVRVMLMASPELTELFQNTCRMADEPTNAEKTPAGKNLYFLVGGRTKTETMGIGGPWSLSLDGPNPGSDPQTLINTGVRTFKGFTGIDLSSCTEWIRFMELRYYRCANSKAPTLTEAEEEREIVEDKTEVVVFLIPNAAHLVPSEDEWNKTKDEYTEMFQSLTTSEKVEEMKAKDEIDLSQSNEENITECEELAEGVVNEPTHYSQLDVSTLKVHELRAELDARNLDKKGVKVSLVSRLQAALEEEKNAELGDKVGSQQKNADQTPKMAASSQPKEEAKDLSEKDRRRLERFYRLGDKPAILVHPNRAARGGRFDCHRVSLFSLLDYRSEEQKEHNFEVSLFAEQFHEMLQRDCAFNIFKAVYTAPEDNKIDGKSDLANGQLDDDPKEPDAKKGRVDAESTAANNGEEIDQKSRKLRRTVDPLLLFSFTYFDTAYAGFIRDYDLIDILHLLDLGYSKIQMRKMVSKVTTRRDHVQYRNLTDKDVVEGDLIDSINLSVVQNDPEFLRDLAAGNDILFGGEKPLIPARVTYTGSMTEADLLKRIELADETRTAIECKFYKIKEELENTRLRLNSSKDTEYRLRRENRDYQNKFKEEQRNSYDNRQLVGVYNYLLRHTCDRMSEGISEITKQFDKERAKKEAESVATVEEEKVKVEPEEIIEVIQTTEGEEKDYEVIDQV